MSRFMIFYFLIYGTIHALIYMRLRPLLPEVRWVRLLVILFFMLMIFAPRGLRILEHAGYPFPARILAWMGYTWGGFAWLFFVTTVASFAAEGLVQIGAYSFRGATLAGASRTMAAAALIAAGLTTAWGLFEAGQMHVERVTVYSDKLPAGVDRIRIGQVSDAHIGLITPMGRMKKAAALLRAESPDIVVATGDLLDGPYDTRDKLRALADVPARWGKYAVIGNHEVYAGLDRSVASLEDAGFTVLRNRAVTVEGAVNLAGVDDPRAGSNHGDLAALGKIDNSLFTLLLKHRPEVDPTVAGRFDLQLSGHTHGGQIFPFNYITRAVYPYHRGLYKLEGGALLYVNRGTGTWGPPIRVGPSPEVTIIDIRSR